MLNIGYSTIAAHARCTHTCNKTAIQLFFIQSQRLTKVFMFSTDRDDRFLLIVYPVYSSADNDVILVEILAIKNYLIVKNY